MMLTGWKRLFRGLVCRELLPTGLRMAGGRDPYWDKVVLAMHMDGANGSTTFTDLKGHAVTVYGNAQISTAQSKFGGASAAFDGSGDYLTVPHSTEFQADTDITVEAFVYPTDTSAQRTIASKRGATDVAEWSFYIAPGGGLGFAAWNTAGGIFCSAQSSSTVPANQWSHVAAARSGSNLYVFINGVLAASSSTVSGTYKTNTNVLNIGRDASNTARDWIGYIDDLRITKGLARYTANFTPTGPFLGG